MKKILLISCLFLAITNYSQEKKLKKNAKISYKVAGICGMCKNRIETAALKTKGVKFALWNVASKELKLIIDERKANKAITQQNILAVGHDIIIEGGKTKKATELAYNSVHPCCKYRDEEIVEDHKGELQKQKKTPLK